MIWTVAKKELRGYFNSAVAVIFLAAFLLATLLVFFGVEKFFARGLADLRPLFKGMPFLLIILVSALSMRLWADERRAGTLEVLLTLPVPRWKLVAGKFVAGMLLIAIALGLTLGLPITIAQMGNLDTGPVLGGYLAALLLAGAYLSIGICVSAVTDNQIVAFVGTALLCALSFAFAPLASALDLPGVGRFLGTGARFESVARGVLDLRDLAYYASIIAVGVALNVLILGVLTWSRGPRARARRRGALLTVGLVAANALAINAWLAPIGRVRIDLTEDRMYSLSPATKQIINGLDERLLIRGYFSEKTHPWLAPLIPQIRDMLDEYRIAGGAKLRVEFVDPTSDDELKAEAKDKFNISSTALPFTSQTEQSVVNAYFAIAIGYGDVSAVLGIDELIQVRAHDMTNVEVTLRNLEYQVTKSIKKVVAEFTSTDAMFASATQPIKLTAYLTPKTMPESLKDAPEKLKKVLEDLKAEAKGKLEYAIVEPKYASQPEDPGERAAAEQEAREIRIKHGARGIQLLGSDQIFYYSLVAEIGDRPEPISMPKDVGEAAYKTAITETLQRSMKGLRRVVGVWVPPASPPMMMEGMPPQQELPPPQAFQRLQQDLAGTYEVRPVKLDSRVPGDVDALLLAGPANLDAKAVENVDQFVMRGGSLVVLGGRHRMAPDFMTRGLKIEPVTTGLEAVFEKWGIKLGAEAVADKRSEAIMTEVPKDLGNGMTAIEMVKQSYALFPRITADDFSSGSVITGGLAGAVMAFASPVTAEAKVGEDEHRVEVLLQSSGGSWLARAPGMPDWRQYPEHGTPPPGKEDKTGSHTLALTVAGAFASGVAKPSEKGTVAAQDLLDHSPKDTRIVVFGSSSFASDLLLGSAQQLNSDLVLSNVALVHNALDWALSDTDLMSIRARTPAARAITVKEDERSGWILMNFIIAFAALAAVVGFAWFRRRSVVPFVAGKEV